MTSKLETLARVFFWVSVFSIVVTFGGCIACLKDSKTEYGDQFYEYKGELRSHTTVDRSGGEGFIFLLPLIAAGVCAISLVIWTQAEKKLEEARQKDLKVKKKLAEAKSKEFWARMDEEKAERLEKKARREM